VIAFIVYAIIFLFLIYRNSFFGLFRSEHLSNKLLALTFLLKIPSVFVFYYLFKILYGGIDDLDAGKFFHDAKVMNDLAFLDFGEYLKMLFGFQDDTEGSFFFKTCIDTTHNWDNGQVKDFLYNDNRTIIRLHSLIHFIAFNSYFVHALFSCFISFTGIFFIFKTFRTLFAGKEIWFFLCILFFPTLWLYTGALLKEAPTVLLFGLTIFHLKALILDKKYRSFLILTFLLFLTLFLKPYFTFYGAVFFALFFMLLRLSTKRKILVFVTVLIAIALSANVISITIKNRSFVQAALKKEMEFQDLSTGGIFLLDSVKFVRLPFDSSLIKEVPGKKKTYTIKKDAPFTYWEHSHQQDTLYITANTDTIQKYSLVYVLPKAGSAINVIGHSTNPLEIAVRSLYYTTAYPLFINARGIMQYYASLENVLLITCNLFVLIQIMKKRSDKFVPFSFLIFSLSLFIVIGITTPNSGAIMRYRAPAAIFIILAALYFINRKSGTKRNSE
jgi:hypothetical protein